MLHMPHRSVTRFFVPLIDVLTLLFCIYLLMPMVGQPEASEGGPKIDKSLDPKKLQEEIDRLKEEVQRLEKKLGQPVGQRLAVRVLEIDGQTGKLSYRDPDSLELKDQAAALALIERDKRGLGGAPRELYYLILYPRDRDSSYPTVAQRERYDRWFEGVPLGYDVPGARIGEKRP